MNNWFTSTFETVREKSLNALDFVRKDLSEFTTTVKNDGEKIFNQIKTQPVGDFDTNRSSNNLMANSIVASSSSDRLQKERIRLQNDESTYLIDPTPVEAYENWRQTNGFHDDKYKGEITQLLVDAPHIRSFYIRLVPACTSHNDFWSRYYFRLHQIDEEETRRINLLKRAHEICNESSGNDWDEPDDETTNQEVTTTTTTSENIICDSEEPKFDETDLVTSETNEIPSNQQEETAQSESTSVPVTTTTKKTDKEVGDDWE